MNDEAGILSTQTEAMLADLRLQEVEQINVLIDKAQQRAQESLREAHCNARRTMHEAIETERKRLQRSSLMAHAALQTQQRLLREAKAKQLLQHGWRQFPEVLRQHWEEKGTRRQWCETLIEEAVRVFGSVDLLVEHPDTLTAEEVNHLQAVARNRGADATFVTRKEMSCGLTVAFKGALLDGTVGGLLANRRHIEARLLNEINRVRQNGSEHQVQADVATHG